MYEVKGVSAPSLDEILDLFYTAAFSFHKEHGKIAVLVIDNANRLALKLVEFLKHLDHAKWASDQGIAMLCLFQVKRSSPRQVMGEPPTPINFGCNT